MGTKVTVTTLAGRYASIAELNANFAQLADEFDKCVYRDGTVPNTLTASLDVNSQRLLNLVDATTAQEPVTLSQLNTAIAGLTAPTSHTGLTDLTTGDPHTQYLLAASYGGRAVFTSFWTAVGGGPSSNADAYHTHNFSGTSDHGGLIGLADDDHTQYHNDARGDARYWQLTTDLATQVELDAHTGDSTIHFTVASIDHGSIAGLADDDHTQYHNDTRGDTRYYQKSEFINVSTGAPDAGKPVVLDAAGNVDASMINDADISHLNITDIGSNTHAQIDSHIADGTLHFTVGSIDHTAILNIGTNTHAQIDTHIANGTIHFTVASIDHTAILNIGTNTHAQIDTHIANSAIHFTVASIDHGSISGLADDDHTQYHNNTRGDARYYQKTEFLTTSTGAPDSGKPVKLDAGGQIDATMINDGDISHLNITDIGSNSHAAIDTHIADTTIHFTKASIDHGGIGGLADDDHTQYWTVAGRNGQTLTIKDAGGTDSVAFSHDGTDFNFVGVNTTDINITGVTNLVISGTGSVGIVLEADTDNITESDQPTITFKQDGGAVIGVVGYEDSTNQLSVINEYVDSLILGANNVKYVELTSSGGFRIKDSLVTDYVQFAHDGSFMNITSVNTPAITTTTPIEFNGGVTYDPSSSGAGTDTSATVGLALGSTMRIVGHTAGYIRTLLKWTASGPIEVGQSGTSLITNIDLIPGASSSVNIKGSAPALRVYDAGLTDYASFSHDGTNFSTTVVNTDNWLVSGFTAGGGLQLRSGAYLYILDSLNTDYCYGAHDGTNMVWNHINTANIKWQFATVEKAELSAGGLFTTTGTSAGFSGTDRSTTGSVQLYRNAGSNHLYDDTDGNYLSYDDVTKGVYLPQGRLRFPATASISSDGNTLDYYKENTFTPAFAGATTSPSGYAVQTGYYTRIGDTVHFYLRITMNGSATSGSGALTITGLPFSAYWYAGISIAYVTAWNTNAPDIGYISGTTITPLTRTATSIAGMDAARVVSNTDIICSGTYKTYAA